MDDDEIEQLIAELRILLNTNGFGWAREQAEAALDPSWHRRWLARALVDAAENVTVYLARMELTVRDSFETEDISFEPDNDPDPDGYIFGPDERSLASEEEVDRLRDPQRREALEELVGNRDVFKQLRDQLIAPT
jgi:hypothetical protein